MSYKIPDRWESYSNKGEVISGTRIFACKVPLKEIMCKQLPINLRFTPQDLLSMAPELCLVVDLTNTYRYYDKEEFLSRNISYQKVLCPGHVIPPKNVVSRFFSILDDFLEENPDGLIAVHCTHGVNRTGYLVCRYMIERLNVDPEKAVNDFRIARGHAIERQNYVADLHHSSAIGRNAGDDPAALPTGFRVRGFQHRSGIYRGEDFLEPRRRGPGPERWSTDDHSRDRRQRPCDKSRPPRPYQQQQDSHRHSGYGHQSRYQSGYQSGHQSGHPSGHQSGYRNYDDLPGAGSDWASSRSYYSTPREASSWRNPLQRGQRNAPQGPGGSLRFESSGSHTRRHQTAWEPGRSDRRGVAKRDEDSNNYRS